MPVDTSFYPKLNPTPPPNALEMMSQMQGIQGQQLSNQLTARTMAAQQAIGQAAQGALRADGTTDLAAYQQAVQGSPDAAFGGQDAANNAQSQATAQQALQAQQVALASRKLDILHQQAGALADDPELTTDKVHGVINSLTKIGLLDAPHAADILGGLPQDPSQLRSAMRTFQLQAEDAQTQIAQYHSNTLVNNGQQTTEQNVGSLAPAIAPVQMQMSPGEAASPVTGPVGPNGEQTTTPLGQRADMGTIATGQGPAKTAAQTTSGGLAAQGHAAFQQQRAAASQNEATFNLLQSEIPKAFTGAGAEQRTSWTRIAQTLGLPVDKDTITASESVTKALQKMINAQPNASQSDRQLASQIAANPHPGLSKDGLTQMVAIAKGNNAQQIAVGNAWDKIRSKVGEERFNEALPLLNQRMPTAAFQYMALPQNMQHVLTDGMSKAEFNDLMRTVAVGKKAGWLK